MNKFNKKGQTIGGVIITAIGIIVALTLLVGGVTEGYGTLTQTVQQVNQNLTLRSDQATTLTGKNPTSVVVRNGTSGTLVAAANYTITKEKILADGTLGSTIQLGTGVNAADNNTVKTLNYTYEPLGYATDSATRSIAGLILIFAGLAVAVFALVPILRNDVLGIVK